jgi:AbrB family looped-hinge helix DNA binding protein
MEIKMVKTTLEKQGRIFVPKKIREKLGLRTGEELSLEVREDEIIVKPFKNLKEFSSNLRGCVKNSKIDPLDIKKIWKM